jgi:hypothetical protein
MGSGPDDKCCSYDFEKATGNYSLTVTYDGARSTQEQAGIKTLPEVISDGPRRNIQSFGQFNRTGIPAMFHDEVEKKPL